jgi:hypothetical protein
VVTVASSSEEEEYDAGDAFFAAAAGLGESASNGFDAICFARDKTPLSPLAGAAFFAASTSSLVSSSESGSRPSNMARVRLTKMVAWSSVGLSSES